MAKLHVILSWQLVAIFPVMHIFDSSSASYAAMVPAMFVFGDSLADDGNNNFLPTLAKATSRPYGMDYPGGPTGRFCNGRTVSDYIGEFLGLPSSLPPYLNPSTKGWRVLKGVNYASSAGGILQETGKTYGARIPFNGQISNFRNTLTDISAELGNDEEVAEYLSKSIFYIVIGSNDYLNNYLMPKFYPLTRLRYSSQSYRELLISDYSSYINTLYSLGARKFVISLLGPLGCIPEQRVSASLKPGQCLESVNEMAQDFNRGLAAKLNNLSPFLPGSALVYHNCYNRVLDAIKRPASYGFRNVADACCGLGRLNAQILCNFLMAPCSDRNSYVFWDSFHPTQALNIILARGAFDGGTFDAFPMNIRRLAEL